MEEKHRRSILLIGPMGVGKSTIGEALARHYGLPLVALDDLRKELYAKMPGYSRDEERSIYESNGDLHTYYEPFETQQIEWVLDRDEPSVFDFGGGHTVKSEKYFQRILVSFAPYENVIFLTISPNNEKTIHELHFESREGIDSRILNQYNLLNRTIIDSECNAKLAKHVVYRNEKTVDETLIEIINWIDHDKELELK
jgi:shikimate kinase